MLGATIPRMPTKPNVCAFCLRGDRQITTEHAIAQWIQELFPPHSQAVLCHGDSFKRSWEIGKKNAYRINDVCSCCNTPLGKIETVAHDILKPLILNGMQTAITAEQARILTAWFYKTVVACDLIKPIRTEPYFSPEDRGRVVTVPIEAVGAIGNDLYVWIASCLLDSYCVIWQADARLRPLYPGDSVRGPIYAHVSTLAIGKIAFQMFTLRIKGFPWKEDPFPSGTVLRLWPQPEGTIGPIAKPLDPRSFGDFRRRLAPFGSPNHSYGFLFVT